MTTTDTSTGAPSLAPPSQRKAHKGTISRSGQSRPREILLDDPTVVRSAGAAPRLTPPGMSSAVAVPTGVTGAWTSGVTIDAAWTINESRNAFFHVAGAGWKKVFNGTDGAFTALLTLITQAKQTGHQVALREEADGLVHEVFLW